MRQSVDKFRVVNFLLTPGAKYYVLHIFLLLMHFDARAQFYKEKPTLIFSFEKRNSFVQDATADLNGIKLGVDFDNKVKITLARYKLVADIVEQKTVKTNAGKDTTVRANLQMLYVAPGAEYVIYKDDVWQVSVPVEVGFGKSYFEYFVQRSERKKILDQSILLIEPGISGHYKLVKWIGLGFGAGYRSMLQNNKEVDTRMSSFTFSLGIKIFFSEVYKSVFPRGIKL